MLSKKQFKQILMGSMKGKVFQNQRNLYLFLFYENKLLKILQQPKQKKSFNFVYKYKITSPVLPRHIHLLHLNLCSHFFPLLLFPFLIYIKKTNVSIKNEPK